GVGAQDAELLAVGAALEVGGPGGFVHALAVVGVDQGEPVGVGQLRVAWRQAVEGAELGVKRDQPGPGVDIPDAHLRGGGGERHALLVGLEAGVGGVAVGRVPSDADDADDAALGVAHGNRGVADVADPAVVRADDAVAEADRLAAGVVAALGLQGGV